jgi:hypothetical protein
MKRTGQPLGLKKRKNRQHAPNLDADDLAMQCEAAPYRLDRAGLPGYELCERALAIDPDNVRALVQLAMFYGMRVSGVQSPDSAGRPGASEWIGFARA